MRGSQKMNKRIREKLVFEHVSITRLMEIVNNKIETGKCRGEPMKYNVDEVKFKQKKDSFLWVGTIYFSLPEFECLCEKWGKNMCLKHEVKE